MLYIFYILHQTTTSKPLSTQHFGCISFISYIKPQLMPLPIMRGAGCISFISYIKPQPTLSPPVTHRVVYLLYPTSNHNLSLRVNCKHSLYIFYILHQTTTNTSSVVAVVVLYIFYILHQTTTYSGEFSDYQDVMLTLTGKKWCAGCCFYGKGIKKFRAEWAR